MIKVISATIALIALININPAEARSISEDLATLKDKRLGCSAVKRRLKVYSKQFSSYNFAFAGRRAPTFTRIRGCGYAWNKSKGVAERNAMRNCREWEKTYGTGGGKYVCSLHKLK